MLSLLLSLLPLLLDNDDTDDWVDFARDGPLDGVLDAFAAVRAEEDGTRTGVGTRSGCFSAAAAAAT